MNTLSKTPSFFSGKNIGKSLREVAVELIQTESDDMISRWFHSESGTDLFTWVDSGKNIIKQQISFHGQVVEWNCLDGIKTGVIIESELESESAKPAGEEIMKSESIQFDGVPLYKSVDLALEILDHLNVETLFRAQLIDNFKNPQNIQTLSPRAFVDRFGVSREQNSRKDPGLWSSLQKTFKTIFLRKNQT